MYCPNCGTENENNAKYCRSCGALLHEEQNNYDYQQPTVDNQNVAENYNDNYNGDYNEGYNNGYNEDYSNNYNNNINDTYGENYNGGYSLNNNSDYNNYPQKPPKKKSKAKLIIIVVVIAVVLLSALSVSLYFFVFKDMLSSDNTTSSDTSISHVSDTIPTENSTPITESSTTVTGSTEPSTLATEGNITVPNLVGLDRNKAIALLQKNNLNYREIEDNDSSAKDTVYDQSPSAGEKAYKNDEVILFISKGSKSYSDYDDSDSYILPDSDKEYITEDDIKDFDKETLNLALNEIYARKGQKFNTDSIQEYFDQKDWYYGTVEPGKFDDSDFNDYERKNVDTIVNYMKKKGYR